MSRLIFPAFFLFLLLFVCCQLCGQGSTVENGKAKGDADKTLIDDFLKQDDKGITEKLESSGSSNSKVKHIDLVSLVAANKVIFAMAEVNYTDNTDKNITVVAKYFETTEGNWGDQAFSEKGEKWEVKSGAEKVKDTSSKAVIKSFAATAKGNTIYHITISNSTFESSTLPEPSPPGSAKWHARLVEGTVSDSVGGKAAGKKEINLKSSTVFLTKENDKLEELGTSLAELPPSDGFAFVSDDNNIFFFMKGKTTKDGGNKNIVAVFKIEDSAKLGLLSVDISEECYSSFFHWEGEIIMTPGSCQDKNNHNVKVFKKEDKKFDNTEKTIARLRDFLKDKNNFTTAKIGDINVLLCTQQKDVPQKGHVTLWVSDGTHVRDVGTIIKKIEGTFDGSVLYTKEEFIALHQKYNTGDGGDGQKEANTFLLKRLKTQLEEINFFLGEWRKSNETVLNLCENTRNTNIHCIKSPPIAGLVGFLHETTNEEPSSNFIWKDIYYYSNVTIENGNAVSATNGLKFNGTGKGTEWSVESEQKEKPYNFIDFGFTILATVTIEKSTNNVKNSVLGIKLKSAANTVGLWCTTDGKWGVTDKKKTFLISDNIKCEQDKTYNIALVLQKENNKNLQIYVNGEHLKDLKQKIVMFEEGDEITHFYFGADGGDVESHVTVADVLLYNRPFDGTEINNLKEYVKSVEVVNTPPQNADTNTGSGGSDPQTPTPLPTDSYERKENEKAPSPSRTEDGGVGGGVRVFSLLLALLCVSAPLLHL